MEFNKPNVVVPLVPSYDTRNIAAYTAIVTTGIDQQKVNCYYQRVDNKATQSATYELTKRPGVTTNQSFGSSSQTPYLIVRAPGAATPTFFTAGAWVVNMLSGDIRVSSSAVNTTVLSPANNYRPAFVSMTNLSGTETVVLQLRDYLTMAQRVYTSSAIATFTEIVDAVFAALSIRGKMEFMDGFGFALTSTNRIHQSNINTLSVWGANDYITKNIQQDIPNGLAKFKNQLLAFGMNSVEVFVNSGLESGSVLRSMPALASDIGIGMNEPSIAMDGVTRYSAIVGDFLYIIGRDDSGPKSLAVLAWNGERFERVSTSAIERAISQTPVYSLHHMSIYGEPALAVQLTAPDASSQRWFMFFPEHKEWFEWNSPYWSPVNWDGAHLVALIDKNRVAIIVNADSGASGGWTDPTNAGFAYTMSVQFRLPKQGRTDRNSMKWCALDADTRSTSSNVSVEFSDNDYQSFATARTIDLSDNRKRLTRCGTYFGRAVRLSHSANDEFRIRSFLARVE